MEPIVEELISHEELMKIKDKPGKKVFLGYWYNCIECGWDGYLPSTNQLMCPRCGSPFFFDDGQYEQGDAVYKIDTPSRFTLLKHAIGEGIVVDENPEEA